MPQDEASATIKLIRRARRHDLIKMMTKMDECLTICCASAVDLDLGTETRPLWATARTVGPTQASKQERWTCAVMMRDARREKNKN